MIQYSIASRPAIARLMRPYNDIDIFVEDKTYVGVYEKIVTRILSGRARVTKVIPLGPRDHVLASALADRESTGRPRLYIIDSDLDLIAFSRQPRAPHLYRLNAYSFENILLRPEALEDYCQFTSPDKTRIDSIDAVDLNEIVSHINSYGSLYISIIAVARRLKIRDSAFSIDFKSIMKKKNGKYICIDTRKFREKIFSMARRIRSLVGSRKYLSAKKHVTSRIQSLALDGLRFFPGKSIIWHLNEKVGAIGGLSLTQKAIVSYLADRCGNTCDESFAERILKTARRAQP